MFSEYDSNITVNLEGRSTYTPTLMGPKKLHCDSNISGTYRNYCSNSGSLLVTVFLRQ